MQPEVQRPYTEVVWYQSERLEKDPDPAELARFQTAFAYLLTQSKDLVKRLPHRRLAARDVEEMVRLDAAKTAVSKGVSDPPNLANPLPTSIALWPIDSAGKAEGNLPEGSGWVGTAKPKFIFRDRTGERQLGYFEHLSPRPAGVPLVLTAFEHPPAAPQSPKKFRGAAAALLGLFIFVVAMGSTIKTGGEIAEAYRTITVAHQDVTQEFVGNLESYCKTTNNFCEGKPAKTVLADCAPVIAPPNKAAADATEMSLLCSAVWDEALKHKSTHTPDDAKDKAAGFITWIFTFAHKTGESMAISDRVSVVPYFFASILGLLLLFAGLGLGTCGKPTGIAISKQNRLSLSLLQVVLWTVIILSAYATFCAFNVGAMGATWLVKAPADPTKTVSLFPQLEPWAWGVMGIVIASPSLSALIKGSKQDTGDDGDDDDAGQTTSPLNLKLGQLSRNMSPTQASFLDIFMGEDTANAAQLDISRAQNVIITSLLLFTFTGWLIQLMGSIEMSAVLSAFVEGTPILSKFPEPGSTFAALLALTHATYLAGKWKPKT